MGSIGAPIRIAVAPSSGDNARVRPLLRIARFDRLRRWRPFRGPAGDAGPGARLAELGAVSLTVAVAIGILAAAPLGSVAARAAAATAQTATTAATVLVGTPTVVITSTAGVSVGVVVGGAPRHRPVAHAAPRVSTGGALEVIARGDDGAVHRIRAGERLTITLDGRPVAAGIVPDASGRVVPADDRVVGIIDRPGRYVARAWRTDGLAVARSFDVAEGGVFALDLGDLIDLRVETRVEIVARGPVATFRSLARAERVTATLGADRLAGLAPPGATVAGTVRDESGRAVADASGTADAVGRFELSLTGRDGQRHRLAKGDDLLVAWLGRAEPVSFVIPGLTVALDPGAGTISGAALAGWHVEIGMREPEGWSTWRIPTDSAGRYALAPPSGIEVGDSGYVALELSERARVALPWVVPNVEVSLDGAEISGAGVGGQEIEAELMRRGMTIGSASAAVPPSGAATIAGCGACDWRIELRDASGLPVPVAQGDLLRVGVDSGWTEVEVPPLALDANPVTGGVSGSTVAGRRITLALGPREAPRAEAEVVSGADGRFGGAFGAEPMRTGDIVVAAVQIGGITFLETEVAWRLTLDLGHGLLTGHARPGERVVAALDRGGGLAGYAEGSADALGGYTLALLDRDGTPARPQPDDRLRVEAGGRELNVAIPPLDVDGDPERDLVFGSAPAGDSLLVGAIDERGLGGGRFEIELERAGAPGFAIEVGERFDVSGGDLVRAVLRTADGDRFERSRRIPLLAVQKDGNAFHGYAAPNVNVHVEASRSGSAIASGVTVADADGRFAFAAPGAVPPTLAEGDGVRSEWGGPAGEPATAAMVVAPISATIEAAARVVSGKAAPGAMVALAVVEPGRERWPPVALPAGVDGTFRLRLPGLGALPAGTIVDASTDDRRGHRTWYRTVLPRLEVELTSRVVRGIGPPLQGLGLTLSADGLSIAHGTARTDGLGAFESILESAAPAAGIMLPGQVLSVRTDRAPEAVAAALIVPALTVAIDHEAELLHGVGPANTTLALILEVPGRPAVSAAVPVGAGGAWSLHESAFPGGVRLATLRGVTARATTREGHLVSTAAERREFPSPTPTGAPDATETPSPSPTSGAGGSATATATGGTPEGTDTPAPHPPARIFLPWAADSGAR